MALKWDWHWRDGRQGTGYKKLLVAQGSWWDCWLLYYPVGSSIPLHYDKVEGKEHHRLNILLWGVYGFVAATDTNEVKRWWRFTKFRPDIVMHCVPYTGSRKRFVLSIGWVRDATK